MTSDLPSGVEGKKEMREETNSLYVLSERTEGGVKGTTSKGTYLKNVQVIVEP